MYKFSRVNGNCRKLIVVCHFNNNKFELMLRCIHNDNGIVLSY